MIKIIKNGRWQDKPYQNQFNVYVGDKIKIDETTIVDNGKCSCVSIEIADIIISSGSAEIYQEKETKPNKVEKETKPIKKHNKR